MTDSDAPSDLTRPLVSELTDEMEPVSARKIPRCVVVLDEVVNDPVIVLKNELCSCRLVDVVSDPVSVLKNEKCPRRLVERFKDPERLLTNPLTSEPVVINEPAKLLVSAT